MFEISEMVMYEFWYDYENQNMEKKLYYVKWIQTALESK